MPLKASIDTQQQSKRIESGQAEVRGPLQQLTNCLFGRHWCSGTWAAVAPHLLQNAHKLSIVPSVLSQNKKRCPSFGKQQIANLQMAMEIVNCNVCLTNLNSFDFLHKLHKCTPKNCWKVFHFVQCEAAFATPLHGIIKDQLMHSIGVYPYIHTYV